MKTSCKAPCRKSLLTSSWYISHYCARASVKIILMPCGQTTGTNVFLKPIQGHYMKPFAMSRAL